MIDDSHTATAWIVATTIAAVAVALTERAAEITIQKLKRYKFQSKKIVNCVMQRHHTRKFIWFGCKLTIEKHPNFVCIEFLFKVMFEFRLFILTLSNHNIGCCVQSGCVCVCLFFVYFLFSIIFIIL